MIRHILLIRFKPEVSVQSIKDVQAAFQAIPLEIEGVVDVEWGVNNSPENKHQGFTHCVIMTFSGEEGRKTYLPHPKHDALKKLFSPVLDDIIVFDYSL